MHKYLTSGNEDRRQPCSNGQVLANKLGITRLDEIDTVELQLLAQLYDAVFESVQEDQSITVSDLASWHAMWLGNLYDWAGYERSVNMSKPSITFAAATQISRLLTVFERDVLAVYTPCNGFTRGQLITAIAHVHVEFIVIHPFREGNGRLSRLLANVMALQAGWPELDFSLFDRHRSYYFAAIQAGIQGDYTHLEKLVGDTLEKSRKNKN